MKHGIQIYIDQIVEILQVLFRVRKINVTLTIILRETKSGTYLTRNRIASTVRVSECIEECVHRALQQLNKWLLHWVFSRPTED